MNIVPDAIFPHNAKWEIPILRIDKQADFVDLPVRGWGTVSRRNKFQGTWHFYVDDTRFLALWKHPDTLLKTRAVSVVEPNFSTDWQMPLPVVLYRIYQKRWLSRYWQENNIRVFVDLNVPDNWVEYNLIGVPLGWRSYATAANERKPDLLMKQANLAIKHAESDDIRFLVYGGTNNTAKICEENNWVHVRDSGGGVNG